MGWEERAVGLGMKQKQTRRGGVSLIKVVKLGLKAGEEGDENGT
jgi:hypothetical protein